MVQLFSTSLSRLQGEILHWPHTKIHGSHSVLWSSGISRDSATVDPIFIHDTQHTPHYKGRSTEQGYKPRLWASTEVLNFFLEGWKASLLPGHCSTQKQVQEVASTSELRPLPAPCRHSWVPPLEHPCPTRAGGRARTEPLGLGTRGDTPRCW